MQPRRHHHARSQCPTWDLRDVGFHLETTRLFTLGQGMSTGPHKPPSYAKRCTVPLLGTALLLSESQPLPPSRSMPFFLVLRWFAPPRIWFVCKTVRYLHAKFASIEHIVETPVCRASSTPQSEQGHHTNVLLLATKADGCTAFF